MASGHERVMVIRVWNEPERDPPFRARVVVLGAPGAPPETLGVTTSVEDVEAWVRAWLGEQSRP